MSSPGKTIHLRLSPRLQGKLEELHASNYAGLPLSTVAKLLLADQLQKSEAEILDIIQSQIRKPPEDLPHPKPTTRLPGLNAQKRPRR